MDFYKFAQRLLDASGHEYFLLAGTANERDIPWITVIFITPENWRKRIILSRTTGVIIWLTKFYGSHRRTTTTNLCAYFKEYTEY